MIVPYSIAHAQQIEVQPEYEGMDPYPMAQTLEKCLAVTMLDGERVVCCGGVLELNEGRYLAVILFSKHAGKYMREIVRTFSRFYEEFQYNRIEAISACDLVPAHKFLRLLGFECEAPRMRNFHAGRDYALFARIK